MIYEKVPWVGNFNLELMIASDRVKFYEHFTKNIFLIGWKLAWDVWLFELENPSFEKIKFQVEIII